MRRLPGTVAVHAFVQDINHVFTAREAHFSGRRTLSTPTGIEGAECLLPQQIQSGRSKCMQTMAPQASPRHPEPGDQRNDLNAACTSVLNRSGSSQAAK